MEIAERVDAGIVVLQPAGPIDASVAEQFHARLMAVVTSDAPGCLIDFAGVSYISSAGLRVIMGAARSRQPDRHFGIAALNTVVGEIFEISRFSYIVRIFGTVEEALAAFSTPP